MGPSFPDNDPQSQEEGIDDEISDLEKKLKELQRKEEEAKKRKAQEEADR